MSEIKCPNCSTVFKVDDSNYLNIISQIKNKEFEEELNKITNNIKFQYENDLKNEKEKILTNLELDNIKKENEIQNILKEKEREISNLQNQIKNSNQNKELELLTLRKELENKIINKDKEILELQHKNKEIELSIEKEISKLTATLNQKDSELESQKRSIQDNYELQLKQKDEIIEYYRDFKAKQSTKMVGESLEQHCENEFNKIRTTAFSNAEFYKDNDTSSGTKGDYIYREFDENGLEIISIMFEMKNEADETINKKKNEDFFEKLNKDRFNKKCEYAILVSMLEADNEFYNNGIVDVSYKYPKMYVIRPQFFISIISLLRNAALNSLKYKQEIQIMKEQNIDITNFETNLTEFKEKFSKNYKSASLNFSKAIDEIDKAIKRMEEIKRFLTTSENQLRLANNKLEDVTVKKLVRNNPTMAKKFLELENNCENK